MAVAQTRPKLARIAAVVDIGASAVRMEIAQIEPDGGFVSLESLQRAAPLGHDTFTSGRIQARTINLVIEILRGYKVALEPYGAQLMRAVATSAVREAANQETFLERIYMATGIEVEAITGAEEDQLVYAAVRDACQREGITEHEDSLIVEVGAGSLQLTLIKSGKVVSSSSLPLGTLRLTNAVAPANRPGSRGDALKLLRGHIAASIDHVEPTVEIRSAPHFIAVGADARFAADRLLGPEQQRRAAREVPRDAFLRFAREASRLSPEEIARRHGLPFAECQALGPSLLLYAELLKRCRAGSVLVPKVSMRDGLILDLIAEHTGKRASEIDAQTYASAENLGRHYQFDEAHANHVAELACRLFDELAEEHRLEQRDRRLLKVAALLHDIGLFISSNAHHKHTEYLINASEIFGGRADDKSLVAAIARYHRRGLPQVVHPGYGQLTRAERAVVSKLAALLRIADALDRVHAQTVQIASVHLTADTLILRVRSQGDLNLERLAVRIKSDLFQEVFGRAVLLQVAKEQADP